MRKCPECGSDRVIEHLGRVECLDCYWKETPPGYVKRRPGSEFKVDPSRLTRDELFMETAKLVARRSTCERAQVGAVLTKNHRIISIGYNGTPSGMPHCTEVGCEIKGDSCVATIHAEANAVAFAAREGISTEGSEVYVTLSPCRDCAKLMVNAGIRRVIFLNPYHDTSGIDLLVSAGVQVEKYLTTIK